MATLERPASDLESRIRHLISEAGATREETCCPRLPRGTQKDGNFYGVEESSYSVEDTAARIRALEGLREYPVGHVVAVFLNMRDGLDHDAFSNVAGSYCGSYDFLSVAADSSNEDYVRRNALDVIGPNHPGSAQGTASGLYAIAISGSSDAVRESSLSALKRIGVESSDLKAKIRSLSYPWSRQYSWTSDMKRLGLKMTGFPSFFETLLISSACSGAAYLATALCCSYASMSATHKIEDPTAAAIITGVVSLAMLVDYRKPL